MWSHDTAYSRVTAALVRVDLTTGERLTAWKRTDTATHVRGAMAIDPAARALYYVAAVNAYTHSENATVRRLDLETLTETTVTTMGPGPVPWEPSSIAMDAGANRLLMFQTLAGGPRVTSIDLGTGVVTVLAGVQIGSGPPLPPFYGPASVLVAPGGRLFACCQPNVASSSPEIFEIDENTLARSRLAVAWPPGVGRFAGAAFDPALNRLVLLSSDGSQARLDLLDPDTGDLTSLATLPVRSAQLPRTPLGREAGRLFFIDDVGIKEIDLAERTLSLLADLTSEDWFPFDVAVSDDPSGLSIVVNDFVPVPGSGFSPRIVRWRLDTGAMTVLFTGPVAGNAQFEPSTLALTDDGTIYYRTAPDAAKNAGDAWEQRRPAFATAPTWRPLHHSRPSSPKGLRRFGSDQRYSSVSSHRNLPQRALGPSAIGKPR
jgi:hypothetical protein